MGKKKSEGEPLTFLNMMQMGLGQLGYSPSVFYEMTIEELIAAMQGAADKEERAYRQSWTQARWMASVLLAPHSKNGRIKPTDLIRFPWEAMGKPSSGKSKEEQVAHNKRELMALNNLFNGTA